MSMSSDIHSMPFNSSHIHGGHIHGEHCGDEQQVDVEAVKKNIAELENLSSRTLEQTEQLAELYVVQATCGYYDFVDIETIIGPLAQAAQLLKQTLAENDSDENGSDEIRRRLGNVYMHHAEVYNDFDDIDKSLEYYDLAIATFKPLDEKGDGEAKYDIAGIRLNRGTIYHEIGEFDKARTDLDDSFMAYRAVEKISDLDTRYYMAKVSVTQGNLFRDMEETLDKVVDAYNRAMRLFVELIDMGQTEHELDLAGALLGRCMATYENFAGRDGESETERLSWCGDILVDLDRAIEILEKLYGAGNEAARYDLFNAFLSKGGILLDMEKYDAASAIFDRVIEQFADFGEDADPLLLNHYAATYENRGLCLLNLGKLDAAVADFDQAIQLRKKIVSDEFGLDDDTKAVFLSALATTFANRANAHSSKGDTDKAKADGHHGLDLIRSIGGADDAEFREIEKLFENLLEQWK